jgi:competence protein ComEC
VASIALAVSLVLAPLAVGPGDPAPRGPGLRFLDVGQGAALLVVGRDGHAVMIDAGPPGGSEALLHALGQHDVLALDLWVVTHFDSDHVGGFARALTGVDAIVGTDDDLAIGERWDRGLAAPPATAAVDAWIAASAPRRAVGAGDRWSAPGLDIEVVPAGSAPERAAENARGLALCLALEGLRVLVAGDLPAEQVAAAATACGPVDVLWASHHGSRTGISLDVLAAAAPALVIVSAGSDNTFCHPHAETLELLHALEVWVTGLAGASPHGDCPGLAARWGPAHRLAGGDVWLPAVALDR